MRFIGEFLQEKQARQISGYLKQHDIENVIDVQKKPLKYLLWVKNEEDVEKAYGIFQEYLQDPSNKKFQVPLSEEKIQTVPIKQDLFVRKKVFYPITTALLAICVLFYLLEGLEVVQNKKTTTTVVTPLQKKFLYDTPQYLIDLQDLIDKYEVNYSSKKNIDNPEFQKAVEELSKKEDIFFGLYGMTVQKLQKPQEKTAFPKNLFGKIREGQVWRLFTPIFLHGSFLHILFNMLWLWVLGTQIERRLSKFRYILLTLTIAAISNTSQYLASGPDFLGYSGVVIGYLGFIWQRQRVAPWEGFSLTRSMFIFLLIYVLALTAVQLLLFFLEVFGVQVPVFQLANTAHLIGGLSGLLLGKLSYFSWRGQ
jgi:GlpG protein